MQSLAYNTIAPYNSRYYSYNGYQVVFEVITIKEALYRQLRYGAVVEGFVDASDIQLDGRLTIDGTRPWLLLRRITSTEDNQVRYARDRFEMEIVVPDSTDRESLIESIREAIMEEFAGKRKTVGKYGDDGSPLFEGGLVLNCQHINTIEGYDEDRKEKYQILIFAFRYFRP